MGGLVANRHFYTPEWSSFLSGGAQDRSILIMVFSIHRFMAMVVIEFGGLAEFAEVAENYHSNINKLYGNFNKFALAIDKVVQNIVVLMWPINGARIGPVNPPHVVDAGVCINLWPLLFP